MTIGMTIGVDFDPDADPDGCSRQSLFSKNIWHHNGLPIAE